MLHKHSGCGEVHWDLMLEIDDALATWRIAADPLGISPGGRIEAARIHDHRKAYLDYSGPVSGRRGRVELQDSGQLSVAFCDDNLWAFELGASRLQGRFELRRDGHDDDKWTLQRVMDH
ncbi:MAG: DNA polymerase ligase N-terminal domain-containing protein [Phycisphaerae bacterium]|nr:DNA polymerase ligase N-terminal domain-containing protein [Phycisphaerae bacterium]